MPTPYLPGKLVTSVEFANKMIADAPANEPLSLELRRTRPKGAETMAEPRNDEASGAAIEMGLGSPPMAVVQGSAVPMGEVHEVTKEEPKTAFCPECGTPVAPGSRFCPTTGVDITQWTQSA